MTSPTESAYHVLQLERSIAEVGDRLELLADRRALAVLDMAVAGLSLRQIADALGVTRARVSQLLKRARSIELPAASGECARAVADEHRTAARVLLAELRRRIRADAETVRADSWRILDAADAHYVSRRRGAGGRRVDYRELAGGEHDWLRALHPAERERLARWWTDSPSGAADEVAERIGARLPALAGLGTDEVLERVWLRHNRLIDAAGAVARGKYPVAARYSGAVDVEHFAPSVAAEGFRVAVVMGDDAEAVQHVAEVLAGRESDEALRLLEGSTSCTLGPAPWRLSAESYTGELLAIAEQLAGDAVPTMSRDDLERRHAELVPKLLDAGQDWPALHAEICRVATAAGLI